MDNQAFYKKAIVSNLTKLASTAIALSRLFKEDVKLLSPAVHSRRTLKELLIHLALIPREQILLLKGMERSSISSRYTITAPRDFEKLLKESLAFFKNEIISIDLTKEYLTPKKRKISGTEWLIEGLTHFAAHRDQLHMNLMEMKILPPKSLLSRFFETHPVMPASHYKQLRQEQLSVGGALKAFALIVEKYKREHPLKGKTVIVCTHFKSPAIEFVMGLKRLGATVYYHPIKYSQDNIILRELALMPDVRLIESDTALAKALSHTDIILEDGARLSKIILEWKKKPKLKKNLFSIEQTTHGLLFWAEKKRREIPYPIISVANSQIKMHIENNRATPEAILNQFLRATGSALTGKRILILGYGMIGSGLAGLLREHGAKVTIIESYPVRRLISTSHGYETYSPDRINKILPLQDVIISCTNAYLGTTLRTPQFLLMKNGAIVCNGGSGSGEISEEMLTPGIFTRNQSKLTITKADDDIICKFQKNGEEKKIVILGSAHPLNLRNGIGTSSEVIDFVFSLMLLVAIKTNPKELFKKAYTIDQAYENELAETLEEGKREQELVPTLIRQTHLKPDPRPYGSVIKFGKPGVLGNVSVARAVFRANSETKGHYHLNSEEGYFIERGAANITLWPLSNEKERKIIHVTSGDYLTIPRGFIHHVKVTSKEDFVILVVASPPFSFWDQFFLD